MSSSSGWLVVVAVGGAVRGGSRGGGGARAFRREFGGIQGNAQAKFVANRLVPGTRLALIWSVLPEWPPPQRPPAAAKTTSEGGGGGASVTRILFACQTRARRLRTPARNPSGVSLLPPSHASAFASLVALPARRGCCQAGRQAGGQADSTTGTVSVSMRVECAHFWHRFPALSGKPREHVHTLHTFHTRQCCTETGPAHVHKIVCSLCVVPNRT